MSTENKRVVMVDGQAVEVTEEVYRAYYRPIWAENKRVERSNRCLVCSKRGKGVRCKGNCDLCEFGERIGGVASIEYCEDSGYEFENEAQSPEQIVEEIELFVELRRIIAEMDEDNQKLIEMFADGKSERDISKVLGLSQKAINKRKHKIFLQIRNKCENYF